MIIKYGLVYNYIDITDKCLSLKDKNNIITIPCGDTNRDRLFTDPHPGLMKKIFIFKDNKRYDYDVKCTIKINIKNDTIDIFDEKNVQYKLDSLYFHLKLKNGLFIHELPEQKMTMRTLTGNEKVLEIGGNIGRNSLIIGSILKDSKNLVVLETDKNIALQLKENRNINNLNFFIENSALSKRKLIQKGWVTEVSDTLLDGYEWVNIINLEELKQKYSIEFDTLILDCEGAFYYILMDMPEILNNINTIIVENDYTQKDQQEYVERILKENNFYLEYSEGLDWYGRSYTPDFFQVWKKPFSG